MGSSSFISGVRVIHSLVLCVVLYGPLLVFVSFCFLLVIVLPDLLRFTTDDYYLFFLHCFAFIHVKMIVYIVLRGPMLEMITISISYDCMT